ncbi:MAG: hypothetical protein CBB71_08275 [Rhodopirellula sp. TMED11]|nr:MAG: hypothetical protein CBB71_08275 [Rhodopirellula sp. TMED11]
MKIFESCGADAENPRDCGPTVRCDFIGACKHGTLFEPSRGSMKSRLPRENPGGTQHQPE